MLSRRFSRSDVTIELNPNHLLECVTSATSIIATFDLFCRTFGQSHCVLSVNYTVYIAASIFLLQVQASANDQQALRRLEFCIHALGRAKKVNPSKLSRHPLSGFDRPNIIRSHRQCA